MLIMLRRAGDSMRIGDDIEVRVLAVNGSRVKLGIDAPRSIPVRTNEVHLVRVENLAAAEATPATVAAFTEIFLQAVPEKGTAAQIQKL